MRSHTRRHPIHLFLGLFALVSALLPAVALHAQTGGRFDADIAAFEATDRVSPPPASPVLFVGSSSIRIWTDLATAFPDYPVLNRGFGGSCMSDLLFYFNRVVVAYKPAFILVYEGDNDLSGGVSVDQLYAQYVEFLTRVKAQLPGTPVAFLAVKPSPSRVAYLDAMRQFNDKIKALAADDPVLQYIDVFTPMLDAAGQPRPELFGSDMLHMNASGYVLWKAIIGPVLDQWGAAQVRTYLFDFGAAATATNHGPSPDDPVNYWNNVTETIGSSSAGQVRGVVDNHGRAASLGLRMISPFNGSGANANGTLTSKVFPANATRDSLYGNTETWSNFANVTPSFKLTSLNRARTYNLTFYASRTGVTDVRETTFTVTGENSASTVYDAGNNIDKVATVAGITPDAAGAITVSLAPSAKNNNAYRFVYLGVMQVDEVPQQKPVVFVTEPADQTVLEYRPVTFQAAVDSTPPYTVQWLKNGQPIDGACDFKYTIPRVTLDLHGAIFSVSVSNAVDSATSRGAVLHVVPDVNAPTVLSAQAPNGLTIRLAFEEQLDPNTVAPVGNYLVNAGSVKVAGAVLDSDGQTVILTLTARVTGAFTVTLHGVQDLAGNPVAAGTVVSGVVRAQALLFDFGASATPTGNGPSPDDPANYWNNVTDSIGGTVNAQVSNLVATDNTPTGMNLVILSRFNGSNTNGTLASTLFPPDATRDSLFGNTETFSGLSNIFPKFKLTGLDPLLTYDFTFYASRTGVSDNRETTYTVAGSNSGLGTLNAANNSDAFVTVPGIAPTASGEITISLAPSAKNNNANHFTYLGVMKVGPR